MLSTAAGALRVSTNYDMTTMESRCLKTAFGVAFMKSSIFRTDGLWLVGSFRSKKVAYFFLI